jgi:hypothetical protein
MYRPAPHTMRGRTTIVSSDAPFAANTSASAAALLAQ